MSVMYDNLPSVITCILRWGWWKEKKIKVHSTGKLVVGERRQRKSAAWKIRELKGATSEKLSIKNNIRRDPLSAVETFCVFLEYLPP